MKVYKVLNINGAILGKWQLENYLEKVATSHILMQKSKKETYPVPRMIENFKIIKDTVNLLNEHLKLGIGVHPAGEWILDNFYIIEETVKSIEKNLTLKKYKNFIGVQNGHGAGFARIYVLACEIIAYTDCKIGREELESYLIAYQRKKTLSMDEIWNIGIFLQIAIIEKIRQISERIYASQIQKYKAENIVERLVENRKKNELIFNNYSISKIKNNIFKDMKYPFIEYMSYILKRHGKKAYAYMQILEDEVEKTGMSVSDVINKEHFDIAVRKVSMGNSITSIKEILRINFLEVFDKVNGVEEILRQDPANVYVKMDYKTKEYYRNRIKEISNKTKISEIYISKKILEIAQEKQDNTKQKHIGYYLIDEGINELYDKLGIKINKKLSNKQKTKLYILIITVLTLLISITLGILINKKINNIILSIISVLILFVPISEIVIQIIQYILNKVVKPKRIPKIDIYNNIDEENATIVIIPTILKSKEKVQELMKKMEIFYLANKSENLYFTLLGDSSESDKEEETFDKEIIEEGLKQCNILNEKYTNIKFPIFHFIYRNRVWNIGENKYLGWERKRGMINQFNEFILGNIKNPFRTNTLSLEENIKKIPKIKYVITLDSDTDLILNSAFELIGTMAHILNKPIIDEEKNIVVEGYGIIQPRVGVNLDISFKNLFTKIFAGAGGIDFYSNAISDIYQDNFSEGIFTGKGIYDLNVFSKILNKRFPENTVLSHDLLEGNFLRCGLASDIILMDGYPCKYNSFMNRLSRWIRGDWQINKWLSDKSLNILSKYKIFDNLRRSLVEIFVMLGLIFFGLLNISTNISFLFVKIFIYTAILIPFLLEILNYIILKKEGEELQHTFTPKITGLKGVFTRAILTLGCLPYKAYISIIAIIKTLYRKYITHKKLLEWTTSEEAEKLSKTNLISYYKSMYINIVFGIIFLIFGIINGLILKILIGLLWLAIPSIMCYISKEKQKKTGKELLNTQEQEYVLNIAKRTWQFFKDNLNEENNYLVTDNYQEGRKDKIVKRTSSTNIGLSLIAVISAYDLDFINIEEAIKYIDKIIQTTDSLAKWNGHLYNWYNTETKQPLIPRYISTVDSGNFVGYLYIVKIFLENINCSLEERKKY